MITFSTTLHRFDEQGEKTGWTYIEIPADVAEQLKPNNKKSFRVKGKVDKHTITAVALMPFGNGSFILPFNAEMRKATGKGKGAMIKVSLEEDKAGLKLNEDFMLCLEDEPKALLHFNSLAGSHRNYFSKWIDSAKTEPTKAKRIAMAVSALSRKMGYPEMIREAKDSY